MSDIDSELAEGVCFLTMEYVDGLRLSHLLRRRVSPNTIATRRATR